MKCHLKMWAGRWRWWMRLVVDRGYDEPVAAFDEVNKWRKKRRWYRYRLDSKMIAAGGGNF